MSNAPKLSIAEAQAIASAKALRDAKDEKDAAALKAKLAVKSDPSKPSVGAAVKGAKIPKPSSSQSSIGQQSQNHNGASAGGRTGRSELKPAGGVEDFVPDEDIQGFLEDSAVSPNVPQFDTFEEESSEGEDGNPMVAAVEEDVKVDDVTVFRYVLASFD